MNVYEAADKAIRTMNREALRIFGELKLAKFDGLHIIRDVKRVYRKALRRVRKHLWEVAYEAYVLGMVLCGTEEKKARQRAGKAITDGWIDDYLSSVDPVLGYRFDRETDRKAERLTEQLSTSTHRDADIDAAIRYWSKQSAQAAIDVTDEAMTQAYEDAGEPKVMWITRRDGRVCEDCKERDGQIYSLNNIPPKAHWGCRCYWIPVNRK